MNISFLKNMSFLKRFLTGKRLLIIGAIIYALILGGNYIKVSNELLKEIINNNTFQRRLNYDSAIIDREMKCKELGKKLGLNYDLYYNITFKQCDIEILTTDSLSQTTGYRGVITKEYLKDYQFLFYELRKPEEIFK